MSLHSVLVVGAGLIGSSVGLALRPREVDVRLIDADERRLALASDLGAGRPATAESAQGDPADVVVLCVPPAAVAEELLRCQRLRLGRTYSDVASIKTQPQADAQTGGADLAAFVGGHPLAGRERAGPAGARADMFLGRPWVLTPSPDSSPTAIADATELVHLCGGEPIVLTAPQHDELVARVSHLPQALASALAGRLLAGDPAALGLVGQGFRDLTRIADSEPRLWGQIAAGNRAPLARELRAVAGQLADLAHALEHDSPEAAAAAFEALVAAGNAARSRLPGKHGSRRQNYATLPVVVADQPGALARLLVDAGEAGVNVEDLSLEHSPGAPVGLCELLVEPAAVPRLTAVLRERGWPVHDGG
ncbi:MAG: prephenate dehydrogenase [Actinomycetes bacterium]